MRALRLIGLLFLTLCPPAAAQTPLAPAQEQALKAGDSFRECDGCPEMVVIPAGAFLMGSPESEADRDDNEGPQRRQGYRYINAGVRVARTVAR